NLSERDERDVFSWVGATIAEKYRIDEVIGEGGFGVVYRAFHLGLSASVAVKCLRVPPSLDAQARKQIEASFANEAKLMHELSRSSSAIVQALDVGAARAPSGDWTPYMVLELLNGRSLQAALDERRVANTPPWTVAESLQLLRPVALALAEAHERRVAHRDLKPENLFLTEIGDHTTLKLLDFGIAKVFAESTSITAALKATGGSIRAFTPQYGAPEQFDPKYGATGPWTDVFAFALILSELLSGRVALHGQDTIQLMVAAANPGRRPTPRALGADVPQLIEEALARALAVEPAARYASLRQLWSALTASEAPASSGNNKTELAAVRWPERPSAVVPVAPPRPRRGHAPWPEAFAVLGSLAICGGVAYALWRAHSPEPASTAELVPTEPSSSLLRPATPSVSSHRPTSAAKLPRATVQRPTPRALQQGASAGATAPEPTPPPGMVYVPPGVVMMGGDGVPSRRVTISHGFFIDWSELTVSDYQRCVSAGTCTPAGAHGDTVKEYARYRPMCNAPREDRPTHPINCVDLGQAAAYCAFVRKRLPTEAEWEYAARGNDTRRFPWGDEAPACNLAVRSGCAPRDERSAGTLPVGSRLDGASPFGAVDMAGNVWEWVWDGWSEPKSGDFVDLAVAPTGNLGVLKGGSWDFAASELAIGHRLKFARYRSGVSVGIRCAAGGIERAPVAEPQEQPFDCEAACSAECPGSESCSSSCLDMCRSGSN
ncbi:MAG TPA: SUMF1/EgtB/PvdO family nonheme iron enzyme, partial [Polyangiaceae bacterium]|nr:SUMF1/EgtB/PvdO family nonheme iron enzyme [Polyangiaceae bacterium]